jgi:protein-tyrosine-phosphatase
MQKTFKVLFLSRGTASRGLMAEGFLRALAGDRYQPSSAGTDGTPISPLTAEVMREVGIDVSRQKPRQVASLFPEPFHYVVALCDARRERYPAYPFTANLLRWSVPDPEVVEDEPDATKQAFRQVRDQMRSRVEELVRTLNQPERAFGAAA